jgi:hypothetical protein
MSSFSPVMSNHVELSASAAIFSRRGQFSIWAAINDVEKKYENVEFGPAL